jgi:hypothetical protein
MKNGNKSIYPSFANAHQNEFQGLTKREYFAGLFMQGVLSNSRVIRMDNEKYAEYAIDAADELLKALEE